MFPRHDAYRTLPTGLVPCSFIYPLGLLRFSKFAICSLPLPSAETAAVGLAAKAGGAEVLVEFRRGWRAGLAGRGMVVWGTCETEESTG
jgi:hypothetical protein